MRWQTSISDIMIKSNDIINSYIRGMTILAVSFFIISYILLSITSTKYAFMLALLRGLLNYIPFIGPFIAFLAAMFVGVITEPIWWHGALKMIIIYGVIQILDSGLMAPKILGKSVQIHPIAVMFSTIIGGVLFGILATLYNQITSVNDKAAEYFIDYVDTHTASSAFSISAVLTVIVILYVVILILWTGKVFLQYFNMDIQMSEKQLFFESGLVSRNSCRFSFDKVCTLYVKRNIIENWLGCCTIMVRQALNATDEKRGADVKIYGSSHDRDFLNWWLGKDYISSPTVISARSGYGLFAYAIRFDILISFSAIIALCYYGQYFWLFVPIVYMLISLVKGLLAVRRSHITLKEDYMEISNGMFTEVYNYVKYGNVEVVRMVSTPFTPYYHRVKLVISTNGTSFTIRSLKEQEAKNIYELLLLNSQNN